MPKELEEAALIDGCGPLKTFLRVMVPNAAAIYLTGILLSMVWYWNDYYISSMLMDQTKTVTVALSHLREGMWKFVSGKDLELTMLRMPGRVPAGYPAAHGGVLFRPEEVHGKRGAQRHRGVIGKSSSTTAAVKPGALCYNGGNRGENPGA